MVEPDAKVLLIRADANSCMGTGHVMRCIALGQAWQDAGGRVVFISCCDSAAINQRIVEEGFELIELVQAYPTSEDDLFQTIKIAEENGSVWVVTDGYHFNLEYQQGVRRAGFKLLCVDDYNHLPKYEADILLNQNFDAEHLDYDCNPECRKMLGIPYVMLRREFRKVSTAVCSDVSGIKILVTMGGSDLGNASLEVIQSLDGLGIKNLVVKVLVGPSNPHVESLQEAVSLVGINCELLQSVRDMPGLIHWADFAITAAGSTCWELAALNVPFVTVIIADNQERIAYRLDQDAGVPTVGWIDPEFSVRCSNILKSCLSLVPEEECNQRITSLIDCFGVDRILQKPAKGCRLDVFENRLVLRFVSDGDIELLLEWANDPITRSNSFNSEPISFKNHLKWFAKRVGSPDARMFMLEIDGMPCGHIRYELDEVGDAVLSFVVSPFFRGMGIGQKLVELSREEIVAQWSTRRIKAQTLARNRASSSIFEKTGFIRQENEPDHGEEYNTFYWSKQKHEG